jgi:hypothetical protein
VKTTCIGRYRAHVDRADEGGSANQVLILGPGGIPLYLGKRAGFASHHQRQTLEQLYDHCAAEGCEIPSWLCEIHHTDIDRLAPLCSFHDQWVEDPRRVQEERDGRDRFIKRRHRATRTITVSARGLRSGAVAGARQT